MDFNPHPNTKHSAGVSATSAPNSPILLARNRPRTCLSTSIRRSTHRRWLPFHSDSRRIRRLGLGVTEASIVLEEINRSGGNSAAFHAQMYLMGALLRHGSDTQKERWLPSIASGELRLQAFSVTEAEAGSDTTSIRTFAQREDSAYIVNGHKNWTSRIEQSDLLLLLARTTPREAVNKRTDGLSLS